MDEARDDHGRFATTNGSKAMKKWAKRTKNPPPPIAQHPLLQSLDKGQSARTWTDKLPKGMKDETWKGHYDKSPAEGGKPTASRMKQVHEPIIKEALNVKPPAKGEQKLAIMTMGAPASGKSSALRGVDTSKFVKVDPDDIKGKLPETRLTPTSTWSRLRP